MTERLVERSWLTEVARDSGLEGADELAVTLAGQRVELVRLMEADHSELLPTYEVRYARATSGEGPVVDGFDAFIARLRVPGTSELFGVSGEGCNFVGLVDGGALAALCVIREPIA